MEYGINTQLRHEWNVLAVLDPSTRVSLSVIEFTPVESKGEPWKLQGWLPLPDFQISRQFDILCIYHIEKKKKKNHDPLDVATPKKDRVSMSPKRMRHAEISPLQDSPDANLIRMYHP